MAGLRVFVSSTCYDLSLLRSQIRQFIQSLGYEPIMSDYEDILYDPRKHTHTSCISEVRNCDMLVLIIGGRFGGKATDEALKKVDFEKILVENRKFENVKEDGNFSITQLEVLKAIENGMPVYTFIDKKVLSDHNVYEKNKAGDWIDKITFPSIEKQETAKYIFEFINFVRSRSRGNNIFSFEKGSDIEEVLKKQWAAYFQQLLYEERYMEEEKKRIEKLSGQFEDLKTAILSSIENRDQRAVAQGIVKYRRLSQFLFAFRESKKLNFESMTDTWVGLLKRVHIKDIVEVYDESIGNSRRCTFLICEDGTFYKSMISKEAIESLVNDWEEYIKVSVETRKIVIEVLREMYSGIGILEYSGKKFSDVVNTVKGRQLQIEDVININES